MISFSMIFQAKEDGDKPGVEAMLQKVLQLYASRILSKRSYSTKGTFLLVSFVRIINYSNTCCFLLHSFLIVFRSWFVHFRKFSIIEQGRPGKSCRLL